MISLVYGPSSSGKSAWAETRACELAGEAPRAYLATMQPIGTHAQRRIAKHLAQRAGKDFVTFETPTLDALGRATLPPGATALLDDIGNLVANEMFGAGNGETAGTGDPEQLVCRMSGALLEAAGRVRHLVVVADATGEAGWRGQDQTRDWIECCGALTCKLAAQVHEVVEVRGGIAVRVKGTGGGQVADALTGCGGAEPAKGTGATSATREATADRATATSKDPSIYTEAQHETTP